MIGIGGPYIISRQRELYRGLFDVLGIQPTGPVFSVRRTRRTYKGHLLRVRRSSDNAEQDFGYLPNGWLNTSSLLEFVGSGSGFVTIWYDQNGTNNATMATPSRQPRIVHNGVLETVNGRPAVRFIDSSTSSLVHNLEFNRFHSLSTPYVAGASVYMLNSDGYYPYVFGGLNDSGLIQFHFQNTRLYRVGTIRTSLTVYNSTQALPLSTLISRFSQADRVLMKDYVNKNLVNGGADIQVDFTNFSTYLIGNAHILSLQDTNISELIFFADTPLTAAQRDALQDNQIAAFNITP